MIMHFDSIVLHRIQQYETIALLECYKLIQHIKCIYTTQGINDHYIINIIDMYMLAIISSHLDYMSRMATTQIHYWIHTQSIDTTVITIGHHHHMIGITTQQAYWVHQSTLSQFGSSSSHQQCPMSNSTVSMHSVPPNCIYINNTFFSLSSCFF